MEMAGVITLSERKRRNTQEPYVKKFSVLIKLIDDIVAGRSRYDTIAVTKQSELGDTETEFRESLRRIHLAELYLQIGSETHHPADLPMLPWRPE
jgi:hypothetical protein